MVHQDARPHSKFESGLIIKGAGFTELAIFMFNRIPLSLSLSLCWDVSESPACYYLMKILFLIQS